MTTTTAPTNEKSESTEIVQEAERRPAVAVLAHTPAPAQIATVVGSEESGNVNAFASSAAFSVAQRMARALSDSTMVPELYRGSIPNCLIALELSSRIGSSVFAVMQNMDIIHGRPGLRAVFLIATVNTCGRFTALRYRFEGEKGKPSWGCCAVAIDRETGEELVGESITIAMANAEGWSDKKGSKWKTMPGQMLRYRAAAFWTRVYAPELSLGMHTADENEDIGPSGAHVVQQRPAVSTGRRGINQFAAATPQQVDSATAQPTEPEQETAAPDHDPETGETEPDPLDEYAPEK